METMKVRNKRASLVVLPAVSAKGRDDGGFGKVHLLPGVNHVDARYLEALQGNAMVETLFDDTHGFLELVDTGDPFIPEGVKDTLMGTNVDNAKGLIKACGDKSLLEKWMAGDSRATVHRAIAARLAELETKPTLGKPNPAIKPPADPEAEFE